MVSYRYLLPRQLHIRAAAMRNFRCHADRFPERRMRVNRLADLHRIRPHLNRQRNLTNHVACMRADHTTAQYLAVAVRLGAGPCPIVSALTCMAATNSELTRLAYASAASQVGLACQRLIQPGKSAAGIGRAMA